MEFDKTGEMTKAILAHPDIDVNQRFTYKQLELFSDAGYRIIKEHLAIIEGVYNPVLAVTQALLAVEGIDYLAVNEEGSAAVHYAVDNINSEILKLLLEKKDIDVNLPRL